MALEVPIDKIVPLTEARDQFSKIVADLEQGTPLYILTKNGKPAVAIVAIDHINQLRGLASQNSGQTIPPLPVKRADLKLDQTLPAQMPVLTNRPLAEPTPKPALSSVLPGSSVRPPEPIPLDQLGRPANPIPPPIDVPDRPTSPPPKPVAKPFPPVPEPPAAPASPVLSKPSAQISPSQDILEPNPSIVPSGSSPDQSQTGVVGQNNFPPAAGPKIVEQIQNDPRDMDI